MAFVERSDGFGFGFRSYSVTWEISCFPDYNIDISFPFVCKFVLAMKSHITNQHPVTDVHIGNMLVKAGLVPLHDLLSIFHSNLVTFVLIILEILDIL